MTLYFLPEVLALQSLSTGSTRFRNNQSRAPMTLSHPLGLRGCSSFVDFQVASFHNSSLMARARSYTLLFAPQVKNHLQSIDRKYRSLIRAKIDGSCSLNREFKPQIESSYACLC